MIRLLSRIVTPILHIMIAIALILWAPILAFWIYAATRLLFG